MFVDVQLVPCEWYRAGSPEVDSSPGEAERLPGGRGSGLCHQGQHHIRGLLPHATPSPHQSGGQGECSQAHDMVSRLQDRWSQSLT